jgi:Tfp pilus assembly ATPase PilU
MDDCLIELHAQGLISAEETLARADQKQIVRQHVAK